MVICLERDADLHMAQLMPLPLTDSCFSKIQIGFTFLVLAHLGSPGKTAVKRLCVCVGDSFALYQLLKIPPLLASVATLPPCETLMSENKRLTILRVDGEEMGDQHDQGSVATYLRYSGLVKTFIAKSVSEKIKIG